MTAAISGSLVTLWDTNEVIVNSPRNLSLKEATARANATVNVCIQRIREKSSKNETKLGVGKRPVQTGKLGRRLCTSTDSARGLEEVVQHGKCQLSLKSSSGTG